MEFSKATSSTATTASNGTASNQAAPHRKNAVPRTRTDSPYQQCTSQKDNPTQVIIKQAVDYLIQQLEAGKSETLTAYLGAMARFPNYSFGNILAIARQRAVTYCYTSLESMNMRVCALLLSINGERRPVWTMRIALRTAGISRWARSIIHGANFTICFAGRTFCATILRMTISLTWSASAACCMVSHSRWSGGGQAGKPLLWRTCCTRFSVQVLPVPVR